MKRQHVAFGLLLIPLVALLTGCAGNISPTMTSSVSEQPPLLTSPAATGGYTTETTWSAAATIIATTPESTIDGNSMTILPGTVWGWGRNDQGQLATARQYPYQNSTPVRVDDLSDVTSISAGGWYSLALKSDGLLKAWGQVSGQQTISLDGVVSISAGEGHSLALKADGTVWAWGRNDSGQTGVPNTPITRTYGTTTSLEVPDVIIPTQVTNLTEVIAVAAGYAHSIALKSDGTVWAWGNNKSKQLGNGNTTGSSSPVQVEGLSSIIAIVAGDYHSLAVKSDGTVWGWGFNMLGQLGDVTTVISSPPVQAKGLTGVLAVSGGNSHSLALEADGTVWAWGDNSYGQLGDGTNTNRNTPVQVNGLSGVTAISSGQIYSMALKSDGTVWAWGLNQYGQLGNGTTISSNVPVQVSGLTNIVAISAGNEHSLALTGNEPYTIIAVAPRPPVIVNSPATQITATSATVNADLTSLGTAPSVYVDMEWGLGSGQFMYLTVGKDVTTTGIVSFNLGKLEPGVTYYYRFRAAGEGSCFAEQGSFVTLAIP